MCENVGQYSANHDSHIHLSHGVTYNNRGEDRIFERGVVDGGGGCSDTVKSLGGGGVVVEGWWWESG